MLLFFYRLQHLTATKVQPIWHDLYIEPKNGLNNECERESYAFVSADAGF